MNPRHPAGHPSRRYNPSDMFPAPSSHTSGGSPDLAVHAVNIEKIADRMVPGDTDIVGAGIVMDAVTEDDPSAQ